MKNLEIAKLAKLAATAALYVALCYAFAFVSYGPVQFRIAEMLIVLPYYDKKYTASLIVGTFVANIFMYGIFDMIFGTLATALVCLVVVLTKTKKIIAPAAAIVNGLVIGAMLRYIFAEPGAFWAIGLSVAVGEFAVVLAGVLTFAGIEKTNKKFIEFLKR